MAMDRSYKRSEKLSPVEVQRGNSVWWTRNPMAYDWTAKIKLPASPRAGTRRSMLHSYTEVDFLLHCSNRLIGFYLFQNCAEPECWR